MARAEEIVDPTGGRQQARRRRFLGVALPLIVVGSVVVAILAIAFHAYRVDRRGALDLSRQVLHALQETVAEKVDAYLEPAIRSAALIDDILAHADRADRPVAFDAYAQGMLRQIRRIEAFYLANSAGDFYVVRRARGGGMDTRSVRAPEPGSAAPRLATVRRLDEAGHAVGPAATEPDDFDPRRVAWFAAAAADPGRPAFSAPYLFRPTGEPVITVAIGRAAPDGTRHVAAVDVGLGALSRFVAGLAIGRHGHAVLIDGEGDLIASPALTRAGVDPKGLRLDGSDDPVMTEAWDRTRVLGVGAREVRHDGVAYVTISAPLPDAPPGWLLLLAAPESDFAGFAVAGGRQNLLYSLVIVVLAAALAGLALRQGFRADRAGRLVQGLRERARDESEALAELARAPGLLDPAHDLPLLTERVAAVARARRAGIWMLSEDGALRCEDRFDREEDVHSGGFALARAELPRFLELVRAGEPFEAGDARADERTAEFHRLAMGGARRLALVPIADADGPRGVLALENAEALGRARNLAAAVAAIAGMRGIAPGARGAPEPGEPGHAPAEEDEAARLHDTSLLEGEERTLRDAAGEAIAVYPAAAVMVLVLADPLTTTARGTASVVAISDSAARAAQAIARRHGLPYLRVVNHTLVAAVNLADDPDPAGPDRLADAAIALREHCLLEMEQAGLEAFFQIGLDVGRAIGRVVGDDPAVFNLWGDAVRMAELMAASAADPGTVQVTENAYLRLRERFLLRARGRFYMPRVGVARCFTLAGRR